MPAYKRYANGRDELTYNTFWAILVYRGTQLET